MNVHFDARMASHSGIGRYIRNLTRALLERRPGLKMRLLVSPGQSLEAWKGLPVETAPYQAPIYGLREQWAGSRLMTATDPGTLWHIPHYNAPWRLPRNSVVTIHDLTHLERPDLFSRRRRWLAANVLERALRRAGRLIAVSEATRDAIVRFVPACAPKITVVHHGVEPRFAPPSPDALAAFRKRHGLGRTLLFVGSTRGHKNLSHLLEAFTALKRDGVELILVGPTPQDLPAIPSRVRALGPVDDDVLPLWYGTAEALVLPSSNEGFGLPAVEAMACGTPVICSSIPALTEVVGEDALRVAPADAPALTRALTRMLDDADLRGALGARGIDRAKRFRWETAADLTLQVYRSLQDPS